MSKNYFNITLALAGICQSAQLVQQVAHKNQCEEKFLRISLQSILDLNPPSVCAVYGDNLAHLKMGLETLQSILNIWSQEKLNTELAWYTLRLMILERKLKNHYQAQEALNARIQDLNRQLIHFDLLSETLINAIASIYVDIISPLGSRIQITGKATILKNTQVQAKIRAILLAGIRSAVLWQQVGGSRLQLIFSRNRLFEETKHMLANY